MRDFATTIRDRRHRPANPEFAVLDKRGDGPDPALVQVLLKSITSILEADVTKAEKLAALGETLEQYAEVTGRAGLGDIEALSKKPQFDRPDSDAPGVSGFKHRPFASTSSDDADEKARKEKEKRRRAAAAKEDKVMNKSELMDVAKRVTAGADKVTSRSDLVDAAHKIALAERQPGETIETARARFWESPAGTGVYRAMKVAKVEDAVAAPKLEFGPAVKALHKRADEIRAGKSMTREQAVAKIASDPGEARIWNAARAEERERDQFVA
jgi:hypothetical protein